MPRVTIASIVKQIDARIAELEARQRRETSTETNRYVYAGVTELTKLRRQIDPEHNL